MLRDEGGALLQRTLASEQ